MYETFEDRVIKAKKGDMQAFEFLVKQYRRQIYSLCLIKTRNRSDTEDLVQNIFWKAYDKLHTLRDNKKFFGWIYTIALNQIRGFMKSKKSFVNPDEAFFDSVQWADKSIFDRDDMIVLLDAMERLKEDERTILQWKHIERWSIKEIADALSLSESNVKVKLFRARNKLALLITGGQHAQK